MPAGHLFLRGTVCVAVARTMQEQQLKARQLVLQQQAASAVAAASKTQREVYVLSPSSRILLLTCAHVSSHAHTGGLAVSGASLDQDALRSLRGGCTSQCLRTAEASVCSSCAH